VYDKTLVLVVRKDQLSEFEERKKAEGATFLFEYLRSDFPIETSPFDDIALEQHCRTSIDIASDLGLTDHAAVAWFALMRITIHPRFYEHPNIGAAMANATGSGEDRVAQVIDRTSALDWHEARHLDSAVDLWSSDGV
jgi:hypothetical protein